MLIVTLWGCMVISPILQVRKWWKKMVQEFVHVHRASEYQGSLVVLVCWGACNEGSDWVA